MSMWLPMRDLISRCSRKFSRREICKEADIVLGIFGNPLNGQTRRTLLEERHELKRGKFITSPTYSDVTARLKNNISFTLRRMSGNGDVIFHREICKEADIVLGIFGNPLNGQTRRTLLERLSLR
jgi:hypothetical protein